MSSAFRKLLPTLNRILVRRTEPVTKTASGIILKSADISNIGEVTAVGPGVYDDAGRRIPLHVKVGDRVLLPKFGGETIELATGELHMYRDTDILGVLEDEVKN